MIIIRIIAVRVSIGMHAIEDPSFLIIKETDIIEFHQILVNTNHVDLRVNKGENRSGYSYYC